MLPRRLFTFVLIAASMFSTNCTVWKEKPAAWTNATAPEQFERLFWQAVKAKNWKAVEAQLSATYVALTPTGVLDRTAALAQFKQLDLTDYSIGDFVTEPNGNDMVVTYTMTMRGSFAGHALPATPVRMRTVWQQVKHGWIAIAYAQPIMSPFGRE